MAKGITVYCASADDIADVYFQAAHELGRLIAKHGLPVINGGGKMGLMRAVSDGALNAGGEAIGVIPQFMVDNDRNYDRLTQTIITQDMAQRKKALADMAIGVIALPGGVGTLEEVTEMMTKVKLNLWQGAVVLLNINHYYDPLIQMLELSTKEGFSYGPVPYYIADTPAQAIEIVLSKKA